MEKLVHFSHDHPLNLVQLQPNHNKEEEEEEEEDVDVDHFVVEDHHVGQCNMCKEDIYSFHLCYYTCKTCDYSLHKFCVESPKTLQDHPLHDPNHNLTLSERFQDPNPSFSSDQEWTCGVCNRKRKNFFNYHCSICKFNMDIICATMSQQKIVHPSHHHQLQRNSKKLVSTCNACGREHEGTFYQCTTCYWFWIHQDCALSPTKLLIQKPTNDTFTHSHPLTLTYSFPDTDQEAKFYPRCRICDTGFYIYFWLYKCDKCRYHVHIHCASLEYVQFLRPGLGKICKNFKDDDHPNLLRCPFPDESDNLLKHHFINNQKDFVVLEENHGETLKHLSHQHPLILSKTQDNNSDLLHNPLKKIQLLCDGCVKPITEIPFYKCLEDVVHCGFVLHEWCARLPPKIEDHPGHPTHTLVLMPKAGLHGVFECDICMLPSNGFAYGCKTCEYYIDVNCAFLPKEITHEAHPDHLLSRIDYSSSLSETPCNACGNYLINCIAFHCPSCDFYLDTECAFMLPTKIRHKFDKHPLTLRYCPVENHRSDYFCEICEDEFNPELWFYHCSLCVQSMHTACAPVILQCEQAAYAYYKRCIFNFVNVKFGGTRRMLGYHPHCVTFSQGTDGECNHCFGKLQYMMIFKCTECKRRVHYKCANHIHKLVLVPEKMQLRRGRISEHSQEEVFMILEILQERRRRRFYNTHSGVTKEIFTKAIRQIKKHDNHGLP